jgi:hypothetical protein
MFAGRIDNRPSKVFLKDVGRPDYVSFVEIILYPRVNKLNFSFVSSIVLSCQVEMILYKFSAETCDAPINEKPSGLTGLLSETTSLH